MGSDAPGFDETDVMLRTDRVQSVHGLSVSYGPCINAPQEVGVPPQGAERQAVMIETGESADQDPSFCSLRYWMISLRVSASSTPANGVMVVLDAMDCGLAMNLSSVASSQVMFDESPPE